MLQTREKYSAQGCECLLDADVLSKSISNIFLWFLMSYALLNYSREGQSQSAKKSLWSGTSFIGSLLSNPGTVRLYVECEQVASIGRNFYLMKNKFS